MNADLMRRNIRYSRFKMESIYNYIKAEEKFNLQNISDDEDDALGLDNFVSKTNIIPVNVDQNLLKLKAKLSIKSTSSKKISPLVRRTKNRITTLKLDTVANTKSIVQEKILIENFDKMQKDLSATIKIYNEGDFFCDWELIYDKPHTETAYAEEDTDLLILQKKYFDRYFSNHFIKTDNERKVFLTKRIEFLHINNVLNLKPEFYDKGKVIYTKFDPANEFFVIYKGKGALMELNDDYVYKKKSDILYNVQDMKIVCYVGEGCVVGLESFNDGFKKYDHNFVIDEDNTVIYRIKMNTINMDNYLKKRIK
jgi:CRP-like cAMP-binding protein